MLYNTLYTGERIDELLEAVTHIKSVVNGWVKMESTEESPINFNELINPGNFRLDHWINGPTGVDFDPPLKVVVSKKGKELYQYVFNTGFSDIAYLRKYIITTTTFEDWEQVGIPQGITTSDEAPADPKANDIWFDTKTSGSIIKYYDENTKSWTTMNPFDFMDPKVYNPDDIDLSKGIYKYIDSKVKNISGGTVEVDYQDHIADATIHVTKEEKESFNAKMTTDTLLEAMQKLTDEMIQYITDQTSSSTSGVDIPAIVLMVTQIENSLKAHIEDTVKHPSTEKRAYWDSKAEKNHTHSTSDIKLSVEDVVFEGTLPMSLIPDNAKERQVNVKTEAEMLALTIKDIQNGDFVFLQPEDSTKVELFIVVDDTKLGTKDAFLSYNVPMGAVTWDDIKNKPTTMDEMDFSNQYTNSQLEELIKNMQTKVTQVESTSGTSAEAYNEFVEKKDYAFAMENLIDLIDCKMKILSELAHKKKNSN